MQLLCAHNAMPTNLNDASAIIKEKPGLAQNAHSKRAFGHELTNMLGNKNVAVSNPDLKSVAGLNNHIQKGLKRSFTTAQLVNEDIPPSKKSRYGMRSCSPSANNEKNTNKHFDMGRNVKQMCMEEGIHGMVDTNEERKSKNQLESKYQVLASSSHNYNSNLNQNEVHSRLVKTEVASSSKYFENIHHIAPWDSGDTSNELACVDYVNDIMARLKTTEMKYAGKEQTDFMSWQKDISARMRLILLDWIIDVHRKFALLPPTLYLCVNLLDRFLSVAQVKKSKLQLTGCACLWLASKYHEIFAPEIRDFVVISDNAFTEQDMVVQESEIVDRLNFQLTVPTSLAFAERFLKIGTHEGMALKNRKILHCLVYYLLEHCLISYQLSRNLPSKIAAACLAYSLFSTNSYSAWPKFLEEETQYTIEELSSLIEAIDEVAKTDIQKCKHRAVRKKYSAKCFYQVSLLDYTKFNVKPFIQSTQL